MASETGSQKIQRLIELGHIEVVSVRCWRATSKRGETWDLQVRLEGYLWGSLGRTLDHALSRLYNNLPRRVRKLCN